MAGLFRCDIDCGDDPDICIGEKLYKSTAAAMVAGGYVATGYAGVHIDDCWEQKHPERDDDGKLVWNTTRFPSGMPRARAKGSRSSAPT